MSANHIKAKAIVSSDGQKRGAKVGVPKVVRDYLGAHKGDYLIFERGCERSVVCAALAGEYFVVSLERPVQVKESTPQVESLEDVVRRKLKGGSGGASLKGEQT